VHLNNRFPHLFVTGYHEFRKRIVVRVMADTEVVRIKTVVPRTVISYVDPSVAACELTGHLISSMLLT